MATFEELNAPRKYRDPATGEIREANPALNPQFFTPATEVGQTTPLGAITSADLQTPTQLNLPSKPQEDITNLGNLSAYINPPPSPAETEQSDIQKRILSLAKETGEKGVFQAEEEQKQQVPEYTRQLTNLKTQLDVLDLEAQKIPIATQQEFVGRGVTRGGIAPIEAERLRANTIQRLGIAAQGLVIQGNLANAKDLVDRAVNLKFAGKERELQYLQTAYTMNKDTLERTDKKRSDMLQIQLQERARLLGIQKDNMSAVQVMSLAATKNNPNDQMAQLAARDAIQLDPSDPQYLTKAFALVGKYQADPLATKKAMLEQQLQEAKIKNLPLEQKKLEAEIKEINTKTANIGKTTSLEILRELRIARETAVSPGQVVNAKSGLPVKLTDTQSQFLSQGAVLTELTEEVKDAVERVGTNAFKGWTTEKGFLVPVIQSKFVNDPNVLDLMQKMYGLNNLFVYFSTGKQLNIMEFDRLAKQTPNFRATVEYNRKATKNFGENIQKRLDLYLKRNGWKIEGEEDASGGIRIKNLKTGQIQTYNGTLTPEEAKAAGYEITP